MRDTLINALGWALIHSLWQSAAIAALWSGLNLALRRASANTRYVIAYIALLAMPIAAISGFISLTQHNDTVTTVGAWQPASVSDSVATWHSTPSRHSTPAPYPALAVWIWLTGVVAMSIWAAAGWLSAQRLKRRSNKAFPPLWQRRIAVLSEQLGIRRHVRLCESALARVPAVIGWLRPVVLIPAGALANLSAVELEAVLAHELAHVRRYDYLANLLQSAIEIVMFYHPAVWWLSKRIRAEREHCCDDLAIAACGNLVVYARALTALEELRGAHPQFAMAATGGPLISRIRRLLGQDEPRRRSLPVWIALITTTLAVAAMWSGSHLRAQNEQMPAPPAQAVPAAQPQPAPAAPRSATIRPRAAVAPAPAAPEQPQIAQAAPTPAPAQAPALVDVSAPHHEGFLGGLVDAGYTQISVDDIIDLKQNGVSPAYIKGMLHAGLGTPAPKQLIALHNNGVSPEFVQQAAASHIPDTTFEKVVEMRRHGVNLEPVQRIHALGFGPFSYEQIIELQRNGVRADLFEALKESGYTKVDVQTAVEATRNGLTASSLRNLREQGFRNLTLEQVIKLRRAGVI